MDDARTAKRVALGREVRALMGRHQVSQTKLGDYLGCKQTGLSRRLRGEIPFDWDEIVAIAEYFDVSLNDLLPATLPTDARSGSSVDDLALVGAGI